MALHKRPTGFSFPLAVFNNTPDEDTAHERIHTAERMAEKVVDIFSGLATGKITEIPMPITFDLNEAGDGAKSPNSIQRTAHSLLRLTMDARQETKLDDILFIDSEMIDGMPSNFLLGNWLVGRTVMRYQLPDDVRADIDRRSETPLPPNGTPYGVVYAMNPIDSV